MRSTLKAARAILIGGVIPATIYAGFCIAAFVILHGGGGSSIWFSVTYHLWGILNMPLFWLQLNNIPEPFFSAAGTAVYFIFGAAPVVAARLIINFDPPDPNECVNCGYTTEGLSTDQPRCPECGAKRTG